MREYPVSVHVWIAVRAGDREYAHSRKMGASVMNSIRSARQVQNDILAIAGSEEKAAVHLPSRLIGNLRSAQPEPPSCRYPVCDLVNCGPCGGPGASGDCK